MNIVETSVAGIAAKAIEEVTYLSPEDFNKHYFKKKPVIIRNAIRSSACMDLWTDEYLKSVVGSRLVNVKSSSNGLYDYADTGEYKNVEMPFDQAVDLITGEVSVTESYYMQQLSIPDFFPQLLADLQAPELNSSMDNMSMINFWLGGAGCTTKLHYDRDQNFLVQVRGRKELLMYAPGDSIYLYPNIEKKVEHISQVRLDDVDLEKFSLFVNAAMYRCVLNAGDVLYLPPYWWHQVCSLDISISVNYWWNRFDIDKGLGLENMDTDKLCHLLYSFTSKGFNIDAADEKGEPLLLKAVQLGYANVVEAFLTLGANPDAKSVMFMAGVPAIAVARSINRNDIAGLLEQYGAQYA